MSRTTEKSSVLNRVAAKCIDLALFVAMASLLPRPFGPLVGFLYTLVADGFSFSPLRGRSVGKKLMRLQVVDVESGTPARLRGSVLRNAPVGVATFFAMIPVWGWLILAFIGLPLMVIEVSLMLRVESGRRLGDLMGDTEVVDSRELRPKEPVEPTVWPGNA